MLAKALYITQDITYVTDQRGSAAFETPVTSTGAHPNGDLAALLDRLATVAATAGLHEMSVYLDRGIARGHGFPDTPPASPAKAEKHPTMLRARAHEWRVSGVRRWMTFQKTGKPTLHVGLAWWMNRDANPLWDNDPGAAAYLLWRFQNISGIAYHAKPGVLGSIMLTSLYRNNSITWHPAHPDMLDQMTITEYDHKNPHLVDEVDAAGYVHAYDTNRAYLSAAGAADLARIPLVHTGMTQKFHRGIGGLWKVVVPAWNEKRLPHPMGSNRTPGDEVWVSTPTLTLVSELADAGVITMPATLDSYTAPPRPRENKTIPGTTRVLREWASQLGKCIDRARTEELPLEREKLTTAFKDCYKQSVNGLWKTSKSQIFRPDWYYTVDALAGANLYRKLWHTGMSADRWPTYLGNTDAIHYNSTKADPHEDRLKRFVINESAGGFDAKSYTAEQWHMEFGL